MTYENARSGALFFSSKALLNYLVDPVEMASCYEMRQPLCLTKYSVDVKNVGNGEPTSVRFKQGEGVDQLCTGVNRVAFSI